MCGHFLSSYVFARRRAMTFRLDLCIIVKKKVRLYAVLTVLQYVSTRIFIPVFSTPCLFLLFRADIFTPASSTPAFSVPPPLSSPPIT